MIPVKAAGRSPGYIRRTMPTPEQILSGLSAIANHWRGLAIAWHVYFGALVLALVLGARPPARMVALLLAPPLVSVGVLAWVSANPFNGVVFTALAAACAFVPLRRRERVQVTLWWSVPGVMLFAFAWVYPHFLAVPAVSPYLYASPLGLIPCPTLAAVTGVGLMTGGLGSRAWMLAMGAAGVFYSLFGAGLLGVLLDWVLLGGALILLLQAWVVHRRAGAGRRTAATR